MSNTADNGDEEVNIVHYSSEEDKFTKIIGLMEQIVVDEEFLKLHNDFMEKNWQEFSEEEENKLEYMDIFKEYVNAIEKYIEKELRSQISDFKMHEFERQLRAHENELVGEIFEVLSSFTDFLTFKSMILEYKAMKEGRTVDFTPDISISKCNVMS